MVFKLPNFYLEVQKTLNLFCLVQNGPVVIWVACIGLRGSSWGSLISDRGFSEAFWTFSPKGLEKDLSFPPRTPFKANRGNLNYNWAILDKAKKD